MFSASMLTQRELPISSGNVSVESAQKTWARLCRWWCYPGAKEEMVCRSSTTKGALWRSSDLEVPFSPWTHVGQRGASSDNVFQHFAAFFPVSYCSPTAAAAFKVGNKFTTLPSLLPGCSCLSQGAGSVSPYVIISINHMFRSPSSFPNIILSADGSPCFSIVVSARPQHNKESKTVAVLTQKFPFLSNRTI